MRHLPQRRCRRTVEHALAEGVEREPLATALLTKLSRTRANETGRVAFPLSHWGRDMCSVAAPPSTSRGDATRNGVFQDWQTGSASASLFLDVGLIEASRSNRRCQRTTLRIRTGSVCRHWKIAGRVAISGSLQATSPATQGSCNTSLFFFAGHGMQIDGENYLAPKWWSLAGTGRWVTAPGGRILRSAEGDTASPRKGET